ncbi:hypothetical protein [Saccharothrix obliqua]|uniref:hypothetical protein n=1 Tax=Saccharothrix obliqua TaxID=2861747 RepID=UPI001C60163C|nr:hypothetical protein [Saccharothrix obliqua]MBW4722399.1 hypothetical protein [Saccharothrix obliqua]
MTMSPVAPPVDTWTLDAARAAVLRALSDAHEAGAVTDDAAERWREQVEQVADVVTLHTLVGQHAALDQRICRYPVCFHPPKPYSGSGRRANYCEVVRDGSGHDAHTPQTSLRERRRLERAAGSGVEVAVVKPAGPVEPVTAARRTLPERAARLEAVVRDAVTSISGGIEELKTLVRTIGDEESLVEEIEAIREQADTRVKDAETRARAAERRLREVEAAAQGLAGQLEEAKGAAEEADETSQRIETEAREAAERHAREIDAAHTAVRTAHDEAQAAIEQAALDLEQHKADLDREYRQKLDQWKADHDAKIKEIRDDADARAKQAEETASHRVRQAEDAAARRVEQVEHDAEAKVAAAEADAADARGEVDQVTQEIQRVRETAAADRATAQAAHDLADSLRAELRTTRETLTDLRERLDTQAAEHRATVDRVEQRYEKQLTDLRERLDTQAAEHRQTITALETRHTRQIEHERAAAEEQRARVDTATQQTLDALRAQVRTLTEALDTARTSADATSGGPEKKGAKR